MAAEGAGGALREAGEEKVIAATFVALRVGLARSGRVTLEVTGFGAEASPPPAPGLPPFVELPTLRCEKKRKIVIKKR